MASFDVRSLSALEILDSRGRPTLAVSITLGDGSTGDAGVPSGASTGTREAVELRDGDRARFAGKGVQQAVGHVNGDIAGLLQGRSWSVAGRGRRGDDRPRRHSEQGAIGRQRDRRGLDGAGRALATSAGKPLYGWLPDFGASARLPVPHFNVVNGGAHAPNALDFQEFMIAPLGAPSIAEAVRAGAEVYAALKKRLAAAGYATGLGDEGGFAPDISRPRTSSQLSSRRSPTPATPPAATAWRSRWTPPRASSHRDGAYHGGRDEALERRHDRTVRGDGRPPSRSGASRTASARPTATAGSG